MTKYTRATSDDITRIWKQLWGDLTPEQVREITKKEDEMTPKRPIELVDASKACARAWAKRDAMIDAGDKEGVEAMNLTCELLEERYNSMYQQWQILGGTSNIDSITIPFVDYDEADYIDEQQTRRDVYSGFGY